MDTSLEHFGSEIHQNLEKTEKLFAAVNRKTFQQVTNHHQRFLDDAENLGYAVHGIKNVLCWRSIIYYNCAIPDGLHICQESVKWLRFSMCFLPINSVSIQAMTLTMVGVNICKDMKWPLCWQSRIFIFHACDSCIAQFHPYVWPWNTLIE